MRGARLGLACLVLGLTAARADAQAPDATPAFTLSSQQIFNSREQPEIFLTFRRLDHLDFRVYRVNDPVAFFAKLKDPHRLGNETPIVPQERTWLERIANWKAARRADVRGFVREQFSRPYRVARQRAANTSQLVRRRTLNVNTFAQLPLLNAAQLVTSWREILPPVRDSEYRQLPIAVSAPGIYVVEAVSAPLKAYTVVVVSDVGLVVKTAPGELLIFAANRFTGVPLKDCHVRVMADRETVAMGNTEEDGTFHPDVKAALKGGQPDNLVTLAQCGNETAATDPGAYAIRQSARELVGYIYTDRPVYRPGHVVHIKSIVRWREKDALLPVSRTPLELSVVDGSNKVLLREQKTVDEFGAINSVFTVPVTASLGAYTIRVASGDDTANGAFEVQEYRKPEFDVAVRPAERIIVQGNRLTATIAARYYFGAPVAGGSVTYVVHQQPYDSPLRYEGDSGGQREDNADGDGYGGGEQKLEGKAVLNDQGVAEISVPLDRKELESGGRTIGSDYTARIEARVTDASGREVSGAASATATYGRFLLLATADHYIRTPGEPGLVTVRVLDYDGAPQPGTRLHLTLEQLEYGGTPSPKITMVQQADIAADAQGRAGWPFTVPTRPGSYRVRATAQSEGREVSDAAYVWVPGRAERGPDTEDRVLELIADRQSYAPGDTARLIVRGAEFDSFVLVTKEAQHVSFHRVVKVRSNEAIDVPVAADDVGDTYVSVAFLKDDRLYRAERRLSVPATRHQLTVTAVADRPVIRPGEPGTFTVHVADSNGAPVRAQLSLGLVDEAIYGVRRDDTPDPLRFFYRREYSRVNTEFSRNYSFVGFSGTDQLLLAKRRRRPMTLADFKAERPDRPRVRKDFPDTAFWAGDVTTNQDGQAQVRIAYPDSLTSWRLTARAVTVATDVGTTLAHTTTTKDLIVRVVTPRFLTEGDKVTIPTIVHNYLPDAKTVSVSLAADGLTSGDPAAPTPTRTIQVASNGEQRTDWRFTADAVRPVSVTGRATTDAAGDAMQLSLPVRPAGLQRNAGGSGSLPQAGERTLELTVPSTANASARSVRVALAPSLAGTMLGALDYLTSFPWGCTEQTLSSFVPNLVVLRAMSQMGVTPTARLEALGRQVDDGLKRLYDFQHDDGGWGWWKTDQNHPFMTAYALDGLLQARDNDVNVDGYRIQLATHALQRLYALYPRAVPDLKAYEAYVLARAGSGNQPSSADRFDLVAPIDELWAARSRMTATGRALLLMVLDRQKDSRAANTASELLDSVQTRGDLSWWSVTADPLLEDFADTSVEASALALQALSARDPRNPILERVARWLVVNRTGGYWISTKQTSFALQGLLAFTRARGERPSPITAEVFVNGARVGSHSFDAQSLTAPDPILIESPAAAGVNSVRIVTKGEGALYYDASVRYYDKPAAEERTGSRKLALVRTYATLTPVRKDNRIVYREGAFDGTAQPGDVLLVRLTVAGSADWRYLMLEDPIPAGTEQVEKEAPYELERPRPWYFGSQRELRDDRTVFFLENLSGGRTEFTYLLKVTAQGVFNAMPAHISPMYVPDVSASGTTTTVTVPTAGVR
ncbi:MAG: MG2 domain-containing protein [Acidobacteriota bacterium]